MIVPGAALERRFDIRIAVIADDSGKRPRWERCQRHPLCITASQGLEWQLRVDAVEKGIFAEVPEQY
jgi:hypothetical protein